jgi:hypothetical protein
LSSLSHSINNRRRICLSDPSGKFFGQKQTLFLCNGSYFSVESWKPKSITEEGRGGECRQVVERKKKKDP